LNIKTGEFDSLFQSRLLDSFDRLLELEASLRLPVVPDETESFWVWFGHPFLFSLFVVESFDISHLRFGFYGFWDVRLLDQSFDFGNDRVGDFDAYSHRRSIKSSDQ